MQRVPLCPRCVRRMKCAQVHFMIPCLRALDQQEQAR